jgi:hypothetical protein
VTRKQDLLTFASIVSLGNTPDSNSVQVSTEQVVQ